ncbi:MAG: F0F1 ATP synthase subunit gamma [Acetomicrobium sp.]|uniref:F0F1 ATP synthase subunit gamma n=1 Tax=Acetomicrobium TaxID=49894 RepID=UPI0026EF9439|nr:MULTISPECIES: F0F1 ATP synthase subunit gamma [Acetomicrobium]MDI9377068.1 F0F1 ATP synthase subunit gamma [Synergistota bacterium]MDR9769554.1 F0F1 ATP synthase subunit gamma [Acetomicrobium sp.]HOB11139.1 F0F1 ATP synthase subunit gamma [Acetomicrobium sp.]HOM97747.1 F0F1 ATP synthase subunit gamma [Acetomicrobium sp.]HPT65166.1 F0F1 ATP synthase subunit gamma [Acetomicrobium sp.]
MSENKAKRRRRRSTIEEMIIKTQEKLERTKKRFINKHTDEIVNMFTQIVETARLDTFDVLNDYIKITNEDDRRKFVNDLIANAARNIDVNTQ